MVLGSAVIVAAGVKVEVYRSTFEMRRSSILPSQPYELPAVSSPIRSTDVVVELGDGIEPEPIFAPLSQMFARPEALLYVTATWNQVPFGVPDIAVTDGPPPPASFQKSWPSVPPHPLPCTDKNHPSVVPEPRLAASTLLHVAAKSVASAHISIVNEVVARRSAVVSAISA